jgi:nicotinamide-nucleotide amidase
MTDAELLSIGAELLLGETVDTNAAFLGAEMARIGLPLRSVRMLPDDRSILADAFATARGRSAVVLGTGGLGPTHDDLSREGLADALGEELTEDPELRRTLEARFGGLASMATTNLRQALRVPSAHPLPNPIGSAPGWWVDRDGVVVVLMPGVPSEMRRMFADQVRPRLLERFGARPLAMRWVKAFGIGESTMAERLGTLLTDPPPGVAAGIYARDDGVHVRFSTGDDPSILDEGVRAAVEALGDDLYGLDDETLPAVALRRLGELGVTTLSSWESDSEGALIGVLAGAPAVTGGARYIGGVLDSGTPSGPPLADACLQLSLLRQDAAGRSRVKVAVSGRLSMPPTEHRVHGSGPQRLRRAAFAALDAVRRL